MEEEIPAGDKSAACDESECAPLHAETELNQSLKEDKADDQFATGKTASTKESELAHPSGDSNIDNATDETNLLKEISAKREPVANVNFIVVCNKVKHAVTLPEDSTVQALKHHIHSIIDVAPLMQKIMFKGLLKDCTTLKSAGISNGVKVMVIGSKLQDVISVNNVADMAGTSAVEKTNHATPKSKSHAKIIEKGVPDDVMPGYMNGHEPIPATPLKGMVNKHGNKVRITFKLESDQLWLGTKDRTEKIPLSTIKDVVVERIDDHPGYHMIALQLGPTEQSRYWIYWVPSQYVEAIKDVILGKWQPF